MDFDATTAAAATFIPAFHVKLYFYCYVMPIFHMQFCALNTDTLAATFAQRSAIFFFICNPH